MRVLLAVAALLGALPATAETAVYLVRGRDASLFDQYRIDGFSVQALPDTAGVRLIVRSWPGEAESRAAYSRSRPALRVPAAPDRDALVDRLCRGKKVEGEAEKAILEWVASEVEYDPDRNRPQDPVSVFASRKAYCVGFADLTVDLLRRAGIVAETVQGILIADPSIPGYSPDLSGVYHRWIKTYAADRGWRFADPLARRWAVDSRYVPFAHRSWTKPEDLHLQRISEGVE